MTKVNKGGERWMCYWIKSGRNCLKVLSALFPSPTSALCHITASPPGVCGVNSSHGLCARLDGGRLRRLLQQQPRELESKIGCNLSLASWANPKIYVNHSIALLPFISLQSNRHEDILSPQSSFLGCDVESKSNKKKKIIFFAVFFKYHQQAPIQNPASLL